MPQREQIYGAIFGEAIGDAIGHPIEEKWANDQNKKVDGLLDDNKFTDDTQMFCAIGESLLESPPHKSEEAFMVTLGRKFEEWRVNPLGGSHRAPGGNCMDAVRKLGAGVPWRESGGLDAKGNGSAMRSGIVGCYYWKNPEYAFRIGCLTSVPTHNNLEPILSAGVVAYLVAAQIKLMNLNEAVANALLLCSDYNNPYRVPSYPRNVRIGTEYTDQNPVYAAALFGAAFAFGQMPNPYIPSVIHKLQDPSSIVKDGAGVSAVAEAIFFNVAFDSINCGFEYIVLNAANNSDDTDTIAAISGCIAGARLGTGGIPSEWLDKIELADYLGGLAERIYQAASDWSITFTDHPPDAINIANPDVVEGLLNDEDFTLEEEDALDFSRSLIREGEGPLLTVVGSPNEEESDDEVTF